jgi:hypothetical protein
MPTFVKAFRHDQFQRLRVSVEPQDVPRGRTELQAYS